LKKATVEYGQTQSACGSAECPASIDFCPDDLEQYILGTSNGLILKCSTTFNDRFLGTFQVRTIVVVFFFTRLWDCRSEFQPNFFPHASSFSSTFRSTLRFFFSFFFRQGHSSVVYSLKFNPSEPKIFLSGSADWTVRIWDYNRGTCLCWFEHSASVEDACWAPWSSTNFAAVTGTGKVFVYDLFVNRRQPLAVQPVSKRRLTRVVFSATDPVMLVGDTHGSVGMYKLSPNLRRSAHLQPGSPSVKKRIQRDSTLSEREKIARVFGFEE
jgi:hypothetical protein